MRERIDRIEYRVINKSFSDFTDPAAVELYKSLAVKYIIYKLREIGKL